MLTRAKHVLGLGRITTPTSTVLQTFQSSAIKLNRRLISDRKVPPEEDDFDMDLENPPEEFQRFDADYMDGEGQEEQDGEVVIDTRSVGEIKYIMQLRKDLIDRFDIPEMGESELDKKIKQMNLDSSSFNDVNPIEEPDMSEMDDDKKIETWIELSGDAHQLGRNDFALKFLKKAFHLRPEDPAVQLNIAGLMQIHNAYASARQMMDLTLRDELAKFPSSRSVLAHLFTYKAIISVNEGDLPRSALYLYSMLRLRGYRPDEFKEMQKIHEDLKKDFEVDDDITDEFMEKKRLAEEAEELAQRLEDIKCMVGDVNEMSMVTGGGIEEEVVGHHPVKIDVTDEYRSLLALRDIKSGEVVWREEPLIWHTLSENPTVEGQCCLQCCRPFKDIVEIKERGSIPLNKLTFPDGYERGVKEIFDGIRKSAQTEPMNPIGTLYCSRECKEKYQKSYDLSIVTDDRFVQLMEQPRAELTPFIALQRGNMEDLFESEMYNLFQYFCYAPNENPFLPKEEISDLEDLKKIFPEEFSRHITPQIYFRLISICSLNALEIQTKQMTVAGHLDPLTNLFDLKVKTAPAVTLAALFRLASMANHSCDPNVVPSESLVNGVRAVEFVAIKDIAEGEPILIDYIPEEGLEQLEKKEKLLKQYYFECACPKCSYADPSALPIRKDNLRLTERERPAKLPQGKTIVFGLKPK
ncbi:hypothetical protein PROFUN_09244 [Planoprotostelium fungivorum]|uniref:SET domain-containing protein n=1 Tax=Planoprotostelium fungivorum TaxID=1890364 RepID=A0A2P6NKS6_9EUKA|nr:hypothetical protein PROFUN_09244 [Planoprotostelium fungivorum]